MKIAVVFALLSCLLAVKGQTPFTKSQAILEIETVKVQLYGLSGHIARGNILKSRLEDIKKSLRDKDHTKTWVRNRLIHDVRMVRGFMETYEKQAYGTLDKLDRVLEDAMDKSKTAAAAGKKAIEDLLKSGQKVLTDTRADLKKKEERFKKLLGDIEQLVKQDFTTDAVKKQLVKAVDDALAESASPIGTEELHGAEAKLEKIVEDAKKWEAYDLWSNITLGSDLVI